MRPTAAAATAMKPWQRVLALSPMSSLPNISVPVPRFISLEMIELPSSPFGQRPMISIARIEPVIYVAIKSARPMKPRPRPKKYAANKPVRPVIPVRRAVIRCIVKVPIRTIRRGSNVYDNL
jgi:hypothetical protein